MVPDSGQIRGSLRIAIERFVDLVLRKQSRASEKPLVVGIFTKRPAPLAGRCASHPSIARQQFMSARRSKNRAK